MGTRRQTRSRASRTVSAPASAVRFPAFLDLRGRRVVVVGGGPVAAAKVEALRAAGATLRVVAPTVDARIRGDGTVVRERPFRSGDLDGAWFAVAAATPAVNAAVAAEARRRRLFLNAVDDPAHATAYLGGVVRRGGVTLAISTGGVAPALAGLLREALDAALPRDLGRWLQTARAARKRWKRNTEPLSRRRPLLLTALNRLYAANRRHETGEGAR
jgi:uroporphyrin-III C-methyltransferase / precorrin-2 dehydrogenase / sirohydrochlorin ferrochelatase